MISICQRFVWLTSSIDFCLKSSRIRILFILVFVWVSATKNLSSKPLSSQQEAVLSKGFRFCFPTPISYSKIIPKVDSGILASIDKVEAPQKLRAEIVRKLKTFNMRKIENDITKNDI